MPSTNGKRSRRPGQGLDAKQVRAALKAHAEELFRAAFGEPASPGAHEWRDRKGAVSMEMRGEDRGVWNDFSSEGGDLFDLVAITRFGLLRAKDDFPRVLEEAARICSFATGPAAWRGFPKPGPREDTAPEKDDAARKDRNAAIVMALMGRIRPAAETPAAAYLARRCVTDLPETGMGWLPSVPDLPVFDPKRAALLVWGQTDIGWPAGGQRVLLTPTGRKPKTRVRKPSFGRIQGCPARFPGREGNGQSPLVVAESPESALSIRQATGLEAWAVFGVGNFREAPLPKGRTVILAPDRDARDSKAGRAFRRAAFAQRARGVELLIAEAPEPEGSKRDLNDTLQRKGDDAVRAAVDGARAVTDADMEDPDA